MNTAKKLSVEVTPVTTSGSGMRALVKRDPSVPAVNGIAPMSVDPENPSDDTQPELMFRGLLNVIIPAILFDAVLVATVVHYFG